MAAQNNALCQGHSMHKPDSVEDVVIDFRSRPVRSGGASHRFVVSANEDCAWTSSQRGCQTNTLLALQVQESLKGQVWQLSPIRITALRTFASHVLKYDDSALPQEVLNAAQWIMKLKKHCAFKNLSTVDTIVTKLNLITAEPSLQEWGRMLAFLELSPTHECDAGDQCARFKQSCTFDHLNRRETLREGFVFIKNRNAKMVMCRRLTQTVLVGGICVAFYFAAKALLDEMGICFSEAGEIVFDITLAILLFIGLMLVPNLCQKYFRNLPMPKEFRVWLHLRPNSLSFYYKHSHLSDGLPVEGTLFLLPGLSISEDVSRGCFSFITTCAYLCERYELKVSSIDGVWDLSFRTGAEKDLWKEAICEAMAHRRLHAGSGGTVSSNESGSRCAEQMSVVPKCQSKAVLVHRFQDGKDYFESCKIAIEQAERSIYITDWILSAEVLLGRPTGEDSTELDPQGAHRGLTLAELLRRKAQEDGVQVRVLLFNELAISLPNNSEYAASALLQHPNIRVLRHPTNTITLWSHHEKLCIIDQQIAYIGGIDLAFGRFDTTEHLIKDEHTHIVPGKDLYNPRIAPLESLEKPHEDLFKRKYQPRMPWHDITFCVAGVAAQDAARHFLQRWNNHQTEMTCNVERFVEEEAGSGHAVDAGEVNYSIHSSSTVHKSENPLLAVANDNVEGKLLKSQASCMHANRTSNHADREYGPKGKENNCCYISRTYARCCGNCFTATRDKMLCCTKHDWADAPALMLLDNNPEEWARRIPGMQHSKCHAVRAQVLRSACDWSVGACTMDDAWFENSIHQAYLHEIMHAERLIYIENQARRQLVVRGLTARWAVLHFVHSQQVDSWEQCTGFCDKTVGSDHLENQIAEALVRRIHIAVEAKAKYEQALKSGIQEPNMPDGTFRVILVIPNFPEGAVTDKAVQAVLHYTLMTLSGVEAENIQEDSEQDISPVGSLIKRVQASCESLLEDIDGVKKKERWREFISVNCLRNHDVFGSSSEPLAVMNQIYVHAKLMIVDDRSANINERSQLGDRDSEVCYRILPSEGLGELEIAMNGQPHTATKFAHSLRRSLWAEHLGIEDQLHGQECVWIDNDRLGDPCCDENFKDLWLGTARQNTAICNKYFLEQPADHHVDLKMYSLCRDIADYEINSSFDQQLRVSKFQQYTDNIFALNQRWQKYNIADFLFRVLDVDGNGLLDKDELYAIHDQLREKDGSEETLDDFFDRWDHDKNHQLDEEEWGIYWDELKAQSSKEDFKKLTKGNFKLMKSHKKKLQKAAELQGHLYEYPLSFLINDLHAGNLKPNMTDAEGVIPAMTFT